MGWCFERIDGCCLKWGDTCTFGIEEKRRVLFVIEEKRRIVLYTCYKVFPIIIFC